MDASEVQPRQGDKRAPKPGSRAERGKEDPGGELCLGLPRTFRPLSQWNLACSRMLKTTSNGNQVVCKIKFEQQEGSERALGATPGLATVPVIVITSVC